MVELFEPYSLRIHKGRCQICVGVRKEVSSKDGRVYTIKVHWRDYLKNFLETNMVRVEGDWKRASELFPLEKFPKDVIEEYKLVHTGENG